MKKSKMFEIKGQINVSECGPEAMDLCCVLGQSLRKVRMGVLQEQCVKKS